MLHFVSIIGTFINVLCVQGSSPVTRTQPDDFSQSELICVNQRPDLETEPQKAAVSVPVTNSKCCGCAKNLVYFLPAVSYDDF